MPPAKPRRARNALNAAVKLTDVAREAGVSEITVSRVIRKRGPVAEETRARVEAAIRRVGYVPNRIAGALASAGSDLVGVVLPSLSNIVFPDVLSGIHAVLAPRGYRTVISVTDYDPQAEYDAVRALLSWRPAALIVAGLEHLDATRRLLQGCGVPVAEVMDIDGEPIDIAIGFSNAAAGRETAERLVASGYRRIGYVGHDTSHDLRAGKRREAFMAALARLARPCRGEILMNEASSVSAGARGLEDLLRRQPKLDAVYFSNDDMAIGGMFHCLKAGVEVPRRLAIFGYNGLDIGQALPQPLTTLLTRRREIGAVAAGCLLDRLAGLSVPAKTELAFTFIPGATA